MCLSPGIELTLQRFRNNKAEIEMDNKLFHKEYHKKKIFHLVKKDTVQQHKTIS